MIRIAITAIATTIFASSAWAKCPPGTMYQCTQGFNGKVICGCR